MEDLSNNIIDFISKFNYGIKSIYKYYNNPLDIVSIDTLPSNLIETLKSEYTSSIEKGQSIDEVYNHLFYIVNDFCKKHFYELKQLTKYICPGCSYLGKQTILNNSKILKCEICFISLKTSENKAYELLYKCFAEHNKNGKKCKDCKRFIPSPLNDDFNIKCPYLDCCYVGEFSSLKKMVHPVITTDIRSIKNSSSIQKNEQKHDNISYLKDIIVSLNNTVPYNSSNFTVLHKNLVFKAFYNLLDKYPDELSNYLMPDKKVSHNGFQHKIFQEYIRLLENSIPFSFKKQNKIFHVKSLLDENLNIFSGISDFTSIVDEKLEIKNNTEEFYIGGRKATYSKPYYIGKLLNVINLETNTPILDLVQEYSFLKIKLKDIKPYTKVHVTHLMIPPHYQMGGMVYVNRIRKQIINELKNETK